MLIDNKLNDILENFKLRFYLLIFVFLLTSLSEFLSLGLIIPILISLFEKNDLTSNISESNNFLFNNSFFNKINYLGGYELLIFFTIVLIFKYALILFTNYAIPKFSYDHQKFIRYKILNNSLLQEYFINEKSNIHEKIQLTTNTLSLFTNQYLILFLKFFSNSIILFSVFLFLILYNYKITFIIFFIALFAFFLHKYYFRRIFFNLGQTIISKNSKIIQTVTEFFSAIDEIKIYGKKSYFLDNIVSLGSNLSHAETKTRFLVPIPRLFLEILIVSTFLISLFILNIFNFETNLVTLSLYLYSALRILPLLSEFIQSINGLKFSTQAKNDIYEYLNKNKFKKNIKKKKFENKFHKLQIKNLKFSYKLKKKPLININNILIEKGDMVGISGPSGSGKSTLIKIILGFVKINRSSIKLNSVSDNDLNIQLLSSYIPQKSFIFNTSIRENISLTTLYNKKTDEQIWKILKLVGLSNFVLNLPGKLNYKIKSDGSNLSGGQNQRVAIARAIFHNKQIIFLDESTSALDYKSEESILKHLAKIKSLTKIIISHRKNFLSYCNKRIKINE